jgi:hypothetical protein
MIRAASLALLMALITPAPAGAEVPYDTYPIAVLQALDKVTAKVSTVEAPVGQMVSFQGLRIIARTCRKAPPEETPEAAAFLDVGEVKADQAETSLVFRGWMFASSPALSALEHPVYDLSVKDCK